MTIEYRRIARACLETPVDDGGDRNIMPMQTLIGIDAEPPSHMWLLEAPWDGMGIGDIQVFRNMAAVGDGATEAKDGDGNPVPPEWVWWAAVPRGRVTSYRFPVDARPKKPETAEDDGLPFELPTDAQRETKSRKAREGSAGQGAGA